MKQKLFSDLRRTLLGHAICCLVLAFICYLFKHCSYVFGLGFSMCLISYLTFFHFAEDWAHVLVDNQLSISRIRKDYKDDIPYYVIITSLYLCIYMLIAPISFYAFLIIPILFFVVLIIIFQIKEWWHKV